jgi:hypothetical protein
LAYVLLFLLSCASVVPFVALFALCWWESIKAAEGWLTTLAGAALFASVLVALFALADGISASAAAVVLIATIIAAAATRAVAAVTA